jgi:hypothetical protein
MKHQHGEPPKEEEDGLIPGDAKHPSPSMPQLLPLEQDSEEDER